jgi:hypothetical protein
MLTLLELLRKADKPDAAQRSALLSRSSLPDSSIMYKQIGL